MHDLSDLVSRLEGEQRKLDPSQYFRTALQWWSATPPEISDGKTGIAHLEIGPLSKLTFAQNTVSYAHSILIYYPNVKHLH